MFTKVKKNFMDEVEQHARKNIIKKLEKQGINYNILADADFDDLVASEMEILESDTKKVGTGILIGLAISLVTGI